MDTVKRYSEQWNRELSKIPILNDVESRIGVSKVHLSAGLLILVSLLLAGNFCGASISNFFGFIYPAYHSFRWIESRSKNNDKAAFLFSCWITFGSVIVVEGMLGWFFARIPLYYVIKTTGLLWLYLSGEKGVPAVYSHVIRPIFLCCQEKLARSESVAVQALDSAAEKIQSPKDK